MQILISLDDYCKAYNLQIGVYSPLSYFVGSSDLISIAKEIKLADGSFYPLPIYMPLRDPNLSVDVLGERVDLIYEKLKNYKTREIFLEKENLKKFIFSLFKEN